jgi:hypothetical protein
MEVSLEKDKNGLQDSIGEARSDLNELNQTAYLTTYITSNISDHVTLHKFYKAKKTYIYLESPEEESEFVGCA